MIHKEGVLHVSCRMVWREVECLKNMPIVLHLRSLSYAKAHPLEDVTDLLLYERERVTRALWVRYGGTG